MPKRKVRESLPRIGTVLTRTFRGKEIRATVVDVNPKTGMVALDVKRKQYPSLSAAAKALTGGETNGWRFWGLD